MNEKAIDMISLFERYLAQEDYADSTREGYVRDVNQFWKWFESKTEKPTQLSNIVSEDIRSYQKDMVNNEGYRASTVNRKLSSISAFMEWAKRRGVVKRNPVIVVSKLGETKSKIRYLDQEEQEALLRATKRVLRLAKLRYAKRWRTTQRDLALVIFALNTGLCLTEVCHVRLHDIELSETNGKVRVRGRKIRDVPLNQAARDVLLAWLEVRPKDCPGNDFLWIAVEAEADGALSDRSIQRIIRKLGEEAGLERLSVQTLRHTFAKNLISQREGLEQVAALLGYESLESLRIYISGTDNFAKNELEGTVESIA